MSTLRERFFQNLTGIVAMLVLGAGFVALFAGIDYFFLVWLLGYTVLVPIIAMLAEDHEGERESERDTAYETGTEKRSTQPQEDESVTDALSTLRERYARGELTDEQFERKLDRLLETETPERAVEWRERERAIETEESR